MACNVKHGKILNFFILFLFYYFLLELSVGPYSVVACDCFVIGDSVIEQESKNVSDRGQQRLLMYKLL